MKIHFLNKIRLQWQILLVMMGAAIIPVILIAVISSGFITRYLIRQTFLYNLSSVKQVADNLDSVYRQYSYILEDISSFENFQIIKNQPVYKNKNEERFMLDKIGEFGASPSAATIRKYVTTRIDGELLFVDKNNPSLINGTSYRTFEFNYIASVIHYDRLFKDPLFTALENNPKQKLSMGKPGDGVLSGFEADQKTLMLYPVYSSENEKLSQFFLLILTKDVIHKAYKRINTIKYGTLYILDQSGSLIASNHPSSDDYYDYDADKKQYVLGGNPVFDPDEGMSFKDYQRLNTNADVLKHHSVSEFIKNGITESYEESVHEIIHFDGRSYLFIGFYTDTSKNSLIYLYPLQSIYQPVQTILRIILFLTITICMIVGAISLFFSRHITRPIKSLVHASQLVTDGQYSVRIPRTVLTGELDKLSNSFNMMIERIEKYSSHMEDLVAVRTQEVKEANCKMIRDLKMAKKIQDSLIPRIFPASKNLNLSGYYLPMEDLGGDLFDAVQIDESRIGIIVLDVCGHGVPAALITTMAKVSFQFHAAKNITTSEVIALINEDLYKIIGDIGDFITAFFGIIDTQKLVFEYTNAGHPPAFLVRNQQNILELTNQGPVIGVYPGMKYSTDRINLSYGDKLVLYTDGIPESRNRSGKMFGLEQFKTTLITHYSHTKNDYIQKIIENLMNHLDNSSQKDDITLLIAEIALKDTGKH